MPDDVAVEANLVTRETPQVTAEATEVGVELLEDDSLGLNFTDLFGDNSLRHLLEDDKSLLDDLNTLHTANNLMFLLDNNLFEAGAVEVVDTVEVIEVVQ